MKLHNKLEYIGGKKPRGRVGTLIGYSDSHKAIVVKFDGEDGGIITMFYSSLAELNEEWEDYEPQEPLIKDEKIRKAVRAWAEANFIHIVKYDARCLGFKQGTSKIITFNDEYTYFNLEDNKAYTITELCGEEE